MEDFSQFIGGETEEREAEKYKGVLHAYVIILVMRSFYHVSSKRVG